MSNLNLMFQLKFLKDCLKDDILGYYPVTLLKKHSQSFTYGDHAMTYSEEVQKLGYAIKDFYDYKLIRKRPNLKPNLKELVECAYVYLIAIAIRGKDASWFEANLLNHTTLEVLDLMLGSQALSTSHPIFFKLNSVEAIKEKYRTEIGQELDILVDKPISLESTSVLESIDHIQTSEELELVLDNLGARGSTVLEYPFHGFLSTTVVFSTPSKAEYENLIAQTYNTSYSAMIALYHDSQSSGSHINLYRRWFDSVDSRLGALKHIRTTTYI